MVSETITKNDLTAILNEVLPVKPSEYKTLLWTNPNPSSTFGSQTVVSNCNLTQYDEIEVYYAANTGYPDNTHSIKQPVGTNSYIFGSSNSLTARNLNITTTSITFGSATRYAYAGDGSADNAQLIPQKIYGIRYNAIALPVETNTYSTTEQPIGTWINGKTIYRKVLTGTSTSNTTSINVSSLNIEFPISMNIIIHNTNGNWVFGNYLQTSGSDSFNMYMHENFGTVYLRPGSSYAFGPYWLILEYTKTTD